MSIDRPVLPNKLPRQKVCLYVFLIVFSTVLVLFYYSPLEAKPWDYRPVKNLFRTIYIHNPEPQVPENDSEAINHRPYPANKKESSDNFETSKYSENKNGKSNSDTATKTAAWVVMHNQTLSPTNSAVQNEKERRLTPLPEVVLNDQRSAAIPHTDDRTISSSLPEQFVNSMKGSWKNGSDIEKTRNMRDSTTGIQEVDTKPEASNDNTEMHSATDFPENSVLGIEKGFLVFSENCRIPDLDPMHPSIRHLISKTPPLDCSKTYKALTTSKGQYLFLNKTAVQEKTFGQNYTCCYRTVQRENDGKSDNGVGFGKKCFSITHKTKINQEFITVECQYENGTEFFKEFHSFIHDKPETEKRCNKHMTNKFPYSVLLIGADAVSRLNMHRQLNATAEFLLESMGAVEMFGFNKVGDNTFPNLIPLLTGYDTHELKNVCWKSEKLPLDRCNMLWKNFSSKGYRTFYAEDAPHISSFNYLKDGFLHQPTDYYFRPFIKAYQSALGREKHLNCYWCVGSTSEAEAVLHWTYEFADHFSNRPYFAFSWINSLTHDYLNMGSAGDHMFKAFFQNLYASGALNRTVVILMGDHGMRWGEIRNTYIGRLEERLPMLLIALPSDFKQEHPVLTKNLQENAHRLVTPFDLYATLVNILNLNTNWTFKNVDGIKGEFSEKFTQRAMTLLQPIPKNRSCDDAFIEEHWCTCESSLAVDINSREVHQVVNFIINQINRLLKQASHKCAILSLKLITDARLWQPPSQHKGHSAEDSIYTVAIETKPGGAIFEGTVKITRGERKRTLLGSISRLNLYGNQSLCVDNAILRKYCYCL